MLPLLFPVHHLKTKEAAVTYLSKYPKLDAHGIPNERITLIRLSTGEEEVAIDDGYDNFDGNIRPHAALSQLVDMLKKKVKDPRPGREEFTVPAFVVKDHIFKPRRRLAGREDVVGPHPLSGAERYADDKEKFDAIIAASKGIILEKSKKSADEAKAIVETVAAQKRAAAATVKA